MNSNIGMDYVCDSCGRKIFRFKHENLPENWKTINDQLLCPSCAKHILHSESKIKTLWARLGATLELTEAQYNDIMNAENDPDLTFKAFKAVIDAGCFKINGNCYIPGENGEDIAEFDI